MLIMSIGYGDLRAVRDQLPESGRARQREPRGAGTAPSQPAVSKQRARREADRGRNAGPHQDGFFPGAPQMLRERLGPLSPEAKHQVLAGGALGFYGLS